MQNVVNNFNVMEPLSLEKLQQLRSAALMWLLSLANNPNLGV